MRIRHCRGDTISDYVIVGTGPGGATIANILTGDGRGRSAVVLEAGGNYHDDPLISDASYNRVLLSDFWPEFGWQGMSKNNPPTTNRNFLVPQTGRLVGGSSAIHNTNYVKASVPNLAQWEALLGPSWSPAIIYDAYKQLEHYYGVSSQPETRGEAGPVQVRQVPTTGPLPMGQKTSQALFVVTGVAPIVDYNAPATPNGPTPTWQLFQYPQPAPGVDAARSDAYTAFLGADVVTHPAPDGTMRGLNGRRLEVLLLATAQRILFEDGRAVGVLYVREGVSHVAYGRRGVISGAGFLSAQLLMVSGIGPRPTLETARVPIVYENENVGRNLSNHVATSITFNANPADFGTPPDDKSATTTNGAFFEVPGYGPAGSRGVQYVFQGPITNLNQPTTGSMIATLFELQPFSRGTIDIQSVDFQQEPIVRYNYLLDPRDFTFFDNEIVNRVLPFNTALNALDPLYGLPPATLATLSDPALRANFIRSTVRQTHHGCGMVRMAPRDQGGVVDANGHVYGVSGLVVADTSILPFQPDGNNCATVFATAWLIGQRIRAADGIDYDPCESRDRCRRRCRDE